MKNPRFFYEAESFPAKKAKLLQKAFPHLKLADAQEVTAKALGYSSWFECKKTGLQDKSGPFDQSLDLETLIERQFQQALCLMKIGICSADADKWVRGWGLTGDATLEFKDAIPRYTYWDSLLTSYENGEIDDEAMDALFPGEYFVGDEVRKRPERVYEGVILGPMPAFENSRFWASHQFKKDCREPLRNFACYAFSYQAMENFPKYFKGNSSIFHPNEPGNFLVKKYLEKLNIEIWDQTIIDSCLDLEMNFGENGLSGYEDRSLVKDLISFIKIFPNEKYIISNHPACNHGIIDFGLRNIATLNGNDFIKLLEEKEVDLNKVVWFENIPIQNRIKTNYRYQYVEELFYLIFNHLFENSKEHEPSLRILTNPFASDVLLPSGWYSKGTEISNIQLGIEFSNADSFICSENNIKHSKLKEIKKFVSKINRDELINDISNLMDLGEELFEDLKMTQITLSE